MDARLVLVLGASGPSSPRELLGRLDWWVLVPFHGLIFGATAGELRRRAEARGGHPTTTG